MSEVKATSKTKSKVSSPLQPTPKAVAKPTAKVAQKPPAKALAQDLSKSAAKLPTNRAGKPMAAGAAKATVTVAKKVAAKRPVAGVAKATLTVAKKVAAKPPVSDEAKATVKRPAHTAGKSRGKPTAAVVTKSTINVVKTKSTVNVVKKVAAKPTAVGVAKSTINVVKKVAAKRPVAGVAKSTVTVVKKVAAKPPVAPLAKSTTKAPPKGAPKIAVEPTAKETGKATTVRRVTTTKSAPKEPSKPPISNDAAGPIVAGPIAAGPVAAAPEIVSFASLGVPEELLKALTSNGIASPFPVQALTIPDGLAGRDVCGQAKTGSGKTLAFGIPLVAKAKRAGPNKPTAMVLVPTRELASQVEKEITWLASARGMKVCAVYGGSSMDKQRKELAAGAEVVVATPGRLIDLIGRGDIDLSEVRFLVLDEADRMCDMGFLPNVEWLLRHMPKDRQTLLFSATLGSDVNYMIRNELSDPVRHTIESDTTTVELSKHHFLSVHEMDRVKVVASIVRSFDRALVFVNTKRGCDRLVDDLKDLNVQSRVIHGDLDQSRRDRALRQFSEGQIHVLVATDVAARGLHIDGVDVVVQFDPPDDHKTYLHRAGRTARAGATGVVATLVLWNQRVEIDRLQKRLDLAIPLVEVFSNNPLLADLANFDPTVSLSA
jgi:superfamily II DNA/RNA helicase